MTRIVVEHITPERAIKLIEFDKKNNSTNRTKINKYKEMMLSGKWRDKIGMPIVIKNGELLDGTHRLIAIIETGKSYNMKVEYA